MVFGRVYVGILVHVQTFNVFIVEAHSIIIYIHILGACMLRYTKKDQERRVCKSYVELDRSLRAQEQGMCTCPTCICCGFTCDFEFMCVFMYVPRYVCSFVCLLLCKYSSYGSPKRTTRYRVPFLCPLSCR